MPALPASPAGSVRQSNSSALITAPVRISRRFPVKVNAATDRVVSALTATNTVPTGWPSWLSGPATPVVATPKVAFFRCRTPSAIASATSASTAPRSASSDGSTPSRLSLIVVAYAVIDPTKTSDAPGRSVIAAATRPPVKDSATATVSWRRSSASWIFATRSARSRCSAVLTPRSLAAQPEGTKDIVGPGHHGHDHGDCHRGLRPGVCHAFQRQDVEADRQHLQSGLHLPTAARRNDTMFDAPKPQQGDPDLADKHDNGDPPRQLTEGRQTDQRRPGQGLVCDRVGDLAEVRDEPTAAGEIAVEPVGHRRHHEGQESGDSPTGVVPAVVEQKNCEHRDKQQAQHGQRVGDVPGAGRLCDRRGQRVGLTVQIPPLGRGRSGAALTGLGAHLGAPIITACRSAPTASTTRAGTSCPTRGRGE